MRPIDAETQLCAVIGDPVGHSLSPAIHNAAFRESGLNFIYVAFRVVDLEAFVGGMRAAEGFKGLSVTIPHKERILDLLDDVDPVARRVGSVNTVCKTNGRLVGSTTDGAGVLTAFRQAGVDLRDKRVLFLGAGGAVRAVAFALAESSGAAQLTLLGRSAPRVAGLAEDLRSGSREGPAIEYGALDADLETCMADHDVIIQGTPVGMAGASESETLVPAALLRPEHTVFEMIYRPDATRLVLDAEAAGCTVIRGEEMFLHQAAAQFEAWTGEPAPLSVMREAFRASLS